MKKRKWVIPTIIIGIVAIVIIITIGILSINRLNVSVGRYMETTKGAHILIVDDSLIEISNYTKRDLFENLDTGDKIIVIHGGVLDSFPGKTDARAIFKLQAGEMDDIPQTVIDKLTELGWM